MFPRLQSALRKVFLYLGERQHLEGRQKLETCKEKKSAH